MNTSSSAFPGDFQSKSPQSSSRTVFSLSFPSYCTVGERWRLPELSVLVRSLNFGVRLWRSLVFAARGEVDEGEDVVLDEAREAQEDGVEHQTHQAQAAVQCPLVQMDAHNGHEDRGQQQPHGEDQTFAVQLDV